MASAEARDSIVPESELHAFVVRCMLAVGTRKDHAEPLADLLVAADQRGHYSHGLNRLEMYMDDVKCKVIETADVTPKIISEKAATACVDGRNLLGPVVGKFCIDLAIKKANESGIGWVSAKGSNHFGIAGWYSMRAAEQGMLGMAFTNTSPFVVPTRAKTPTLGTNPISMSAPAKDGDMFVLDMATTTVALGKVELAQRKDESIPPGWGVDQSGKETLDPQSIMAGGGLLPVGGMERSGGYKGYGLAMMVEIFCAILSGATYGSNVRKWLDASGNYADLGQCFVAIDPSAFAPGFTDRMSDLMGMCRNLEPVEGESEVLVAGDPERKHIAKCVELGGIPYHPNQIKFARDIADKYEVAHMKTL